MATNNNERFVLCICIPTYNRINTLRNTVQNLLSCNDKRFQVVIQDNSSTDGTDSFFNQLHSDIICYRKNQINRGASYNYLMSLCNNNSKYSLFVTDKDHVNVKFLSEFIDELEELNPSYGIVELNIDTRERENHKIIKRGENAIKKTAYLCRHPTGYFYRNGFFTQDLVEKYFNNYGEKFPFPFEIFNAHIGMSNEAVLIRRPLLYQETIEETTVVKSFSYSGDNFFFFPNNRMKQFEVFVKDIMSLKLDKKKEKDVSLYLYFKFLNKATLGYMSCMVDERVLAHYCIEKKDVSLSESFKNIRIIHAIYRELDPVNGKSLHSWAYDLYIGLRIVLYSVFHIDVR